MRAFSQDSVLPWLCSNGFNRMPLLYFLALKSGMRTKSDMRIGRPGMGPILSGMPLSKGRKAALEGFETLVNIDKGYVDDSKRMGSSDTRPTSTAPEQNQYGQAAFRRSRLVTPMKIGHFAQKLALEQKDPDNAAKNLMSNCVDKYMAVHTGAIGFDLWFGGVVHPTTSTSYVINQNEQPWSRPLGILAAMATDNVYGKVNRAGLASTSPWMGRRVTTAMAPDIHEIIDEANIGQSTADAAADSGVGDGSITLLLCTKKQFRRYKRQARATGIKYWSEGVPEMAELGYRREVIQVDNTYVTYDPLCPAGYAAGLNLGTWAFTADAKDNVRVTDWQSLCDNGQVGGEEADQAFIISEYGLICWAPYANCLFTNIQET